MVAHTDAGCQSNFALLATKRHVTPALLAIRRRNGMAFGCRSSTCLLSAGLRDARKRMRGFERPPTTGQQGRTSPVVTYQTWPGRPKRGAGVLRGTPPLLTLHRQFLRRDRERRQVQHRNARSVVDAHAAVAPTRSALPHHLG
jgi:hypothetical protein